MLVEIFQRTIPSISSLQAGKILAKSNLEKRFQRDLKLQGVPLPAILREIGNLPCTELYRVAESVDAGWLTMQH